MPGNSLRGFSPHNGAILCRDTVPRYCAAGDRDLQNLDRAD
ncbi:hypothetical protein QUB70_17145 [Microcoleus sp. A003_D6]